MSPHHKYSPVAVSVDAPQLDVGLGSNCGRPRGAVYQGQLSKAASFPDAGHPFIVHIHLSDWWEETKKKYIISRAAAMNQTTSHIFLILASQMWIFFFTL